MVATICLLCWSRAEITLARISHACSGACTVHNTVHNAVHNSEMTSDQYSTCVHLCRYSWTLYCGWNLGIWQSNRFSHPNIAEVVDVRVSHTKKWKQTWICFLKLPFSFDLRKSLQKISTQLLSYPDVNTSWKLSVLPCEKKMCLNQEDTCQYRVERSIVDYFLRTRRRRCWGLWAEKLAKTDGQRPKL